VPQCEARSFSLNGNALNRSRDAGGSQRVPTDTMVYCGPVLRHPAELLPAVDLQVGFAHRALRNYDILPSNSRLKSSSSIRTIRMTAIT